MDNRSFNDVVQGIQSAEKDVDQVLDAARLDRHEAPDRHLSGDQKFYLLLAALGLLAMLGFFAFMLLS